MPPFFKKGEAAQTHLAGHLRPTRLRNRLGGGQARASVLLSYRTCRQSGQPVRPFKRYMGGNAPNRSHASQPERQCSVVR